MNSDLIERRDLSLLLGRLDRLVSEALNEYLTEDLLIRIRESFEELKHYLPKKEREKLPLDSINKKIFELETREDVDQFSRLILIDEKLVEIFEEMSIENN